MSSAFYWTIASEKKCCRGHDPKDIAISRKPYEIVGGITDVILSCSVPIAKDFKLHEPKGSRDFHVQDVVLFVKRET